MLRPGHSAIEYVAYSALDDQPAAEEGPAAGIHIIPRALEDEPPTGSPAMPAEIAVQCGSDSDHSSEGGVAIAVSPYQGASSASSGEASDGDDADIYLFGQKVEVFPPYEGVDDIRDGRWKVQCRNIAHVNCSKSRGISIDTPRLRPNGVKCI